MALYGRLGGLPQRAPDLAVAGRIIGKFSDFAEAGNLFRGFYGSE